MIKGVFGDPNAVMIRLVRRQKKRFVDVVERAIEAFMIITSKQFETYPVGISGLRSMSVAGAEHPALRMWLRKSTWTGRPA